MEIMQLKGFCAVVEEQSFSKAASRIFVSQPAISMQIKSLEEELGEKLLKRSKRKIDLTEAGEVLYQRARNILNELELTRQEIEEIHGLQRGKLNLGCSDTVSTYILPSLLQGFIGEYPRIDITVRNKPTMQIVQMIQDGEIDLGLITLPVTNPQLEIHELFNYQDVAICSHNHPLSHHTSVKIENLAVERLLVLEEGTKSRTLLDQKLTISGIIPESIIEFSSVEVQKAFAEIGLGVAIVPDFSVSKSSKELHQLQIENLPVRTIGYAIKSNRQIPGLLNKFLELLNNQYEVSGKRYEM